MTPTFLPVVGGIELGVHELAERLGDGNDVRVLAPDVDVNRDRELPGRSTVDHRPANYRVIRFGTPFDSRPDGRRLSLRGRLEAVGLTAGRALLRECRHDPPDVINVHYPTHLGLAVIIARRFLGCPTVLSLVGRSDVCRPETPWYLRTAIRFLVRRADRTVSISHFVFPDTDSEESVRVIPYGVDNRRFRVPDSTAALRRRYGIGDSEIVLFSLQRLAPEKRVDILVRMMPSVLDRHPEARLHIGGVGDEEDRIRGLIDTLELHERVRLLGYIDEDRLPEVFSLADLFVFHSVSETLGVVLAQAMSAGKAIVAVDNTCVPEVVADGVNGLLVPAMNPEAMAEAVVALIENPSLRRAIQEDNRQNAVTRFDWDNIAASYLEVFREARRSRAAL